MKEPIRIDDGGADLVSGPLVLAIGDANYEYFLALESNDYLHSIIVAVLHRATRQMFNDTQINLIQTSLRRPRNEQS